MIIQNSKTRDPIAVWFLEKDVPIGSKLKLPRPNDLTLGWDSFRKKLREEGISLDDIKDERWKEKPPDEHHSYDDRGRDVLRVGNKYAIIDGNHSLILKTNTDENMELSNITIMFLDHISCIGINLTAFHDKTNLYFNANPIHRDKILNGNQPLRGIDYYRKTSDETEGIVAKKLLCTKDYNIYIQHLSNEAYVFSLHDNPEGISNFGDDLFKINSIYEWIKQIYLQVDNYWLKKRHDYVGCVICFGKVTYGEKKIEVIPFEKHHDILKKLDFDCDPSKKIVRNETIHVDIQAKQFLASLKRGLLTKPECHEKEREYRLIVTPMFSNIDNDGYLLNGYLLKKINMNLPEGLVSLVSLIV